MGIFLGSLYVQCIYQSSFIGRVVDHDDLYSSNPLLVRRKACFTSPTRKAEDYSYRNICIMAWMLHCTTITVSSTSAYGFYAETRLHCVYDFHAKIVALTINFIALAAAFILGSIIFLAYFKVFRFVSHHNQAAIPNLQQPSVSHIQEAKITKTLVIVVLGFVFCWGPVTLIQFIDMFLYSQFNQSTIPNFLFLFQTICIFASSAINPFIYGFTNKRFRKQYFELLGFLCPSAPQVAPVASGNS